MIIATGDIKALMDIDIIQWVLVGFILLVGITKGIEIISKFANYIGKPIKWLKTRESDHDLIIANAEAIKELAEVHKRDNEISDEHDEMIRQELSTFMTEVRSDIKQFTDNRVNDRSQSREIQRELTNAQLSLAKNVQEIAEKIDEMQKNTNERFAESEKKNNELVQSEIKERIAQSYRRYHVSNRISRMELEALEDLIKTYESHEGMNSFVHSIVQKEMYTWEVIG